MEENADEAVEAAKRIVAAFDAWRDNGREYHLWQKFVAVLLNGRAGTDAVFVARALVSLHAPSSPSRERVEVCEEAMDGARLFIDADDKFQRGEISPQVYNEIIMRYISHGVATLVARTLLKARSDGARERVEVLEALVHRFLDCPEIADKQDKCPNEETQQLAREALAALKAPSDG